MLPESTRRDREDIAMFDAASSRRPPNAPKRLRRPQRKKKERPHCSQDTTPLGAPRGFSGGLELRTRGITSLPTARPRSLRDKSVSCSRRRRPPRYRAIMSAAARTSRVAFRAVAWCHQLEVRVGCLSCRDGRLTQLTADSILRQQRRLRISLGYPRSLHAPARIMRSQC